MRAWTFIMEIKMNEKDTNPKDALGIKKVPMHSVPCGPLMELGLAMMEGGRKYGSHNYRKVGCRASVYYDAIMRHVELWWEGEDIDPDSGLHHLIKAMACCVVIRDSMLMKNWIDDRPIQYPNRLDIDTLNKQAAELIKKYPGCKEPFTEKDKKYPKPLINKLKPLLEEDPLNGTAYPICPLNMYFEGDEDKCDASKCDFDTELRICGGGCRLTPEDMQEIADALPPLKQFEATIECVPAYGWQIRLANGMFLMAFKDLTRCDGVNFQETSIPFYYSTKPEAEVWLDRYLRSLK